MDESFDVTAKDPLSAKASAPPPGSPKPLPPRPPASAHLPPEELSETIRFPSTVEPVTGWLVVTAGAGRGRSFPLGYGVHSVGRAEDQRIRLAFGDPSISRRHVVISYDPAGRIFYVSPALGATLVPHHNGQSLLQPTPLQPADRIRLGKTELLFVPLCGPAFGWE